MADHQKTLASYRLLWTTGKFFHGDNVDHRLMELPTGRRKWPSDFVAGEV